MADPVKTSTANTGLTDMGERRFGRVNWTGTFTLAEREVRRFLNVWSQTIMAPLINAGLLLMIFTIAIGPTRGDVMGVPFMTFLAPGILTMTVIQNAFANTSSSMASAKVQGNIVDTLMPPLSAGELLFGYLFGAFARGVMVASVIALGSWLFLGVGMQNPLWVICFVLLGSIFMGGLGLIAGIFANKFDQLSAISNFIVTPLAFLSGTRCPLWHDRRERQQPVAWPDHCQRRLPCCHDLLLALAGSRISLESVMLRRGDCRANAIALQLSIPLRQRSAFF